MLCSGARHFLVSTQVHKWVQVYVGEGNRLVVQRSGDPFTATLYIETYGPIAREKEMDTSGCT